VSKRLIVFCDGTWNRADQPAPTNVCKLREAVDTSVAHQLVHYEPGVGTRRWERVSGGAFGFGLSRNVQDCYRFLVDNYEPGDELFFFGFSRGAFTARSLAGLVRNSGILCREHRARIEDAYRLYRSRKPGDAPAEHAAEAFRRTYSHPDAEIAFIGVWDTVGALGIPIDGFRLPWLSRRWTFHDTTLSSFVRTAYHAISIDERRKPFVPTLWVKKVAADGTVEEPPPDQNVEQVWFAGVHSDVGGGYPDASLSELPLLWIADRARACGLVLGPDHPVVSAADPCGRLHDSMTAFYRLLGPLNRELRTRDGIPINASLASSVKVRAERDRSYAPLGLHAWVAGGGALTEIDAPVRR
jgi:uncharacterized protein (DUF2235 family)